MLFLPILLRCVLSAYYLQLTQYQESASLTKLYYMPLFSLDEIKALHEAIVSQH